MNWQQIVMIIWFALNIIILIALDGTERTRKIKAAPAIIEYVFIIVVLYSAGFWN